MERERRWRKGGRGGM
jgi:ATP-dependent RNA helicase DDX46/PRP5